MDVLYHYAVILDPTEDEKKAGKRSELVVAPKVILARDQKEVVVRAAREIDGSLIESKGDRLRIAVSPF